MNINSMSTLLVKEPPGFSQRLFAEENSPLHVAVEWCGTSFPAPENPAFTLVNLVSFRSDILEYIIIEPGPPEYGLTDYNYQLYTAKVIATNVVMNTV